MNARTRTKLIQSFRVLSITVFPVVLYLVADSFTDLVAFLTVLTAMYLYLYTTPVRCCKGKCKYSMRLMASQVSFWKERLLYQCDGCGEVIQADIFA